MAKTFKVQQTFKNTTARKTYPTILSIFKKWDEEKSKLATDQYKGEILSVKKNNQVVFTLTDKSWEKGTLPSVVTIYFTDVGEDALVELFHSGIAEAYVDTYKAAWKEILKGLSKGA